LRNGLIWLILHLNFISLRRFVHITSKVLLGLLLFLVIIWILLQTPAFQNYVVKRVASRLSKDLHTTVSIDHVDFRLFNTMLLEGTLVLDQNKDTLLYAKAAKLNITDWFFIKDDIVVKYVGLEDAIVNLNRKDSTWNYQFLADYFSSSKKKSKDTTKGGVKLDLKVLEISRFSIVKKDAWVGTDQYISVNKFEVDVDTFDLRNNRMKINSILLDKPVFSEINYDGRRPPKNITAPPVNRPATAFNEDNWVLGIKDLEIKDGVMAIVKNQSAQLTEGQFNNRKLGFSSINGSLKNIALLNDTLRADILLATNERSGFELKKLSAAFRFTPEMMEFSKLDLVTPTSHLRDYYAMHFSDFYSGMDDFEHAVTLAADFKDSKVTSRDLGYFAPGVKKWNREFQLSGIGGGTIDNLVVKNALINSGNSFFDGDLTIRGLPEMNETYMDIHSRDMRTSYSDLAALIPSMRTVTTPQLSAMGNIRFAGNFTGFINDFVTYGELSTDLGKLNADINMKFPAIGPPSYSGRILTNSFQLGKFISNNQLGNIAFDGKVNGKGFDAQHLDLSIDGRIQGIEYDHYTYRNIIAKGNLKNKIFNGEASIDDPNIKLDNLKGSISFSAKDPRLNFDAEVARLHTGQLGLTNQDFSLTGSFNMNFSGNNIDNFLGYAKIYNAVLRTPTKKLSFDSLTINSTVVNGQKNLALQTNELDASVIGNFKIAELPEAFQLFLNNYYPAYIAKPKVPVHEQNFTFSILTKNIQDYIGLINKKLTGFDNAQISGDLDLAKNMLNLYAKVPLFNYGTTKFYDVDLKGIGRSDTLYVNGVVADIIINDSLHLPGTSLTVTAHNDISDILIKTTGSKTLTEADLSARLETVADGFRLGFNPSSFVINDKKWILEKGGELNLTKNRLYATQVKFVQEKQVLTISTEPSETGSSNDVVLELTSINIGDIAPFVVKTPRLEGLLSGNVRITDPLKNYEVDFDTKINQFRFENDSIGILQSSGTYSSLSGNAKVKAISDNEFYNFTAELAYRSNDSSDNQLKGFINFNHSNIQLLQKYLDDIFTGIRGNATGRVNVSGRVSNPDFSGSIALNDASLSVIYTRTKITFENNSIITFNPGEIDFGRLYVRDTLNHRAEVRGKLYHKFFNNFFFNELSIQTERINGNRGKFILLNTTSKDNTEFYGYVVGDAELSLNGPVSDMRMYITGEPTDSSHIWLPTGETAETGKINYIEFIKFGREMEADIHKNLEANIRVDMELNANPFAKIDVILDETTGDIIKAQGSGKLNISAGTKEPLTIRGRYDLQQGQYTFNFQTFLKTPFTLQEGFIEWHGDPYLANLNMDAIYHATNVDMSSIPTSSGFDKSKRNIDIIFKLRGTLKDPKPDFEFVFPFDNPLRVDPIATEYLKTRMQADKNELNKQVTSLLLFNSFMSDQQRLFSTNNTGNFVTRTLGQILSNTLSSSLSNWLQKILKTNAVNLYTNINTSDFNFEKGGLTQKEIQNLGNFGFRTTFLKNRLLINFGGNVDYRLIQGSNNANSSFLFTPDVSFEYLISPDGKLRVVGFNRSDAGIADIAGINRRNRTGVLLSYRKDFNTFHELFGK